MGVYENLGVKRIINGVGSGTAIGGSIMRPEVLDAMREASRSYVRLPELLDKAGKRIAELAGVDSAYITAGAAAGITVAVAACMAGKDNAKIHQLPSTNGMKDQVIIQAMQKNFYELMIRLAGADLVEIGLANGTEDYHLESAITERTAAIVHFVAYAPSSDIKIEKVIEIAHKNDVPVIVDAAAEFPPFSQLRRWADMGADITVFSGGKGIRGPQSTGLILGRKDLIEACSMNASPNHGVGRPSKVGKEEIAGLVTAIELFANEEVEQSEIGKWVEISSDIVDSMSGFSGVNAYRLDAPPTNDPYGSGAAPEGVPIACVDWDMESILKTPEAVAEALDNGTPSILVTPSATGIRIVSHTLERGDQQVIVSRLADILMSA